MKYNRIPFVLGMTLFSIGAVGTSFGFTAITNVASVTNTDVNSNGQADVGDSFTVLGGSFASYFPSAGDPAINGGDLNKYLFNMFGQVSSVSAATVTYFGSYEIYYDGDSDGVLDPGAGGPDFSYSSGTLDMMIDFSSGSPFGPFAANGMLHQTAGPEAGFPSNGFATSNATFTGTYTQNSTDANGTVQGSVQSVPDGGSTLVLLGLAALGTAAAKRRFNA